MENQRPFPPNYPTHGNGIVTNLNPSSATFSIQDLEAQLLRLELSSSMAAVDVPDHHSWLPYFVENHDDSPNFFQHQNEYPLSNNGVRNNFHAESSRSMWQLGAGEPLVGASNGSVYGHAGRGITRRMAMDGEGFKVVKRVIERGDLREIQNIVEGVKDCIHELMLHPLGNDVVQTLFQFCHQYFIKDLLLSVIGKQDLFLAVCLHTLGQKAVVKLMYRLRNPQHQLLFALVMSRHSVALAKSCGPGHDMLMHCFHNLSRQDNEMILLEIAHKSLELAKDRVGCCILPFCIAYAEGTLREVLVTPLVQEARNLSTHFYGNFIIQFLIELDEANIGSRVIQVLRNKFVELCLSKAGSHVVEKCLSCGEDREGAAGIILEIMENKENWIRVFTNQYGNYVAQKALTVAKGEAYNLLVRAIKSEQHVLQFHPYGRSVVAAIKRRRRSSIDIKSPVLFVQSSR